MKTPIILIEEDTTIMFYKTVEDAESYIELIDAKDGIYVAYDAEGYKLDIDIVTKTITRKYWKVSHSKIFEIVKIVKPNDSKNHKNELEKLIKNYYNNDFLIRIIKKMKLNDLVNLSNVLRLIK